MVVAGAGFDQQEPDLEDRGSPRDEQIAKIDELYKQLGRSRDTEPHPMDEIASALPFERLERQREPSRVKRIDRTEGR